MAEKEPTNSSLSARLSLAAAVHDPGLERNWPEDEKPAGGELSNMLEAARGNVRSQFGTLQNIEVEFVRSPVRGQDFDARHNRLLITRQAVEILLRGDPEEIKRFRAAIADCGGFLLPYNGVGTERTGDAYDSGQPEKGGWLMAEASGIPVRSSSVPDGRVVGADAQIYVPPDKVIEYSSERAPLPVGPDDRPFEGDSIIAEILRNPQTAMLISDISAVPEWQRFGFAAACEDGAFKRVITEINKVRENANGIKYALAAIASLKGVQDKNHRNLTDVLDPGLRFIRSVLLHTLRSNRAPGVILGKQVGHTVPAELPCGEQGHLLLDWYLTAQPLAGMNIRDDITLREEELNH